MLRFRADWTGLDLPPGPLTPDTVRRLADLVLDPRHFFTAADLRVEFDQGKERTERWEVFRGRLLDAAHTRLERTFQEWNVFLIEGSARSPEPVLSVKVDRHERHLHVVRALPCHVWEGYDSGGGVFLSREATRWVRELTGTILLNEMANAADLLDELVCQVFHAVVGASRLPLTSVETPLPDFTLGRLAYCFLGPAQPDLQGLNVTERARFLEMLLHTTPFEELPGLVERLGGVDVLSLLRTVFNEASLSPWTDLVDKSLALLHALERTQTITAADSADFLTALLVQVGRHLTAYDLLTFHHRGANYPDALLLDAVLKDLLGRIEKTPQLYHGPGPRERLRRRGLRQGWMLRRLHEGLPVPDAPTSPGENQRVLPPPHVRVPEEQILQPAKRRRVLYADDPLRPGPYAEQAFRQSIDDLAHPDELRELGLALFLDRPLGTGKAPGEADQTVLLSHRAFSRSIARQRLLFLGATNQEGTLESLPVPGLALEQLGGQPRPGAVSVADARQVAPDFVFLRTSPATVEELFRQYDFRLLWDRLPLEDVRTGRGLLIVPRAGGTLTIHDSSLRPRLELIPDLSRGYVRRAGRELVRGGLRASLPGVATAACVVPAQFTEG